MTELKTVTAAIGDALIILSLTVLVSVGLAAVVLWFLAPNDREQHQRLMEEHDAPLRQAYDEEMARLRARHDYDMQQGRKDVPGKTSTP